MKRKNSEDDNYILENTARLERQRDAEERLRLYMLTLAENGHMQAMHRRDEIRARMRANRNANWQKDDVEMADIESSQPQPRDCPPTDDRVCEQMFGAPYSEWVRDLRDIYHRKMRELERVIDPAHRRFLIEELSALNRKRKALLLQVHPDTIRRSQDPNISPYAHCDDYFKHCAQRVTSDNSSDPRLDEMLYVMERGEENMTY